MRPGTCSECGAVGIVETHEVVGSYIEILCRACHRAVHPGPVLRGPRVYSYDVDQPDVTWEGDEESRPLTSLDRYLIRAERAARERYLPDLPGDIRARYRSPAVDRIQAAAAEERLRAEEHARNTPIEWIEDPDLTFEHVHGDGNVEVVHRNPRHIVDP